jgi:hypothetical protein
LPLCLTKRMWSGCTDPLFLTSALVGGESSAASPGGFTSGERAYGTHWIRDWVGPRAGLDDVERILDPTETRTPMKRWGGYKNREAAR